MKYCFLPAFFLCSILKILPAQGWERYYGTLAGNEFGRYAATTADGGFLLLTDGSSGPDYDTWLIKTDWDGDTLWSYILAGPAYQTANGLCRLNDGRFIAVSQSTQDITLILKLSANGTLLDSFSVTGIYNTGGSPKSISQSGDGNLLLAGLNYDGLDYVPSLIKIDTAGAVIWSLNFSGLAFGMMNVFAEISDGNYVACGSAPDTANANFPDGFLVKVSPAGTMLWSRLYGDTVETDGFFDFLETPEGHLLISGIRNNQDAWLLKTDLNGNSIWQRSFPYASGNSLALTSDGNYAMAGTKSDTLVSVDGMLMKTDTTGSMIWQHRFGDAFTIEQFRDMIVLPGDRFLLTGEYRDPAAAPYDIFLVKTDTLGNSFTDVISGKLYMDFNTNCTREGNETLLPGWLVKAQSPDQTRFAFTDNNGNFAMVCDTGAYNVTHRIQGYRVPVCPVSPNSYTVALLNPYDTAMALDFADNFIPGVQDLQVWISALGGVNPGFDFYYKLTYRNYGTDTANGTLSFVHDTLVNWVSSQPPFSANTANQYDWNFSSLLPDEVRSVIITMHCDSLTPLNTVFLARAWIMPVVNDTVPSDNLDSLWRVVGGPYDPNDKQVDPPGTGPSGLINSSQELVYRIRFQNTGTDTARTVVVRDTLDQDLDISTFRMLTSSHPCVLSLTDNRILKWKFDDIQLPDSGADFTGSMGDILFAIKPYWFSQTGTEIRNSAAIYFDYNAPVITNSTLNTIGSLTGISGGYAGEGGLSVYPNPSPGIFNIVLPVPGGGSVRIMDLAGRIVHEQDFSGNSILLDLSARPAGLYFYEVLSGDNRLYRGKIIRAEK